MPLTTAQVVETSVTDSNSPIQDYVTRTILLNLLITVRPNKPRPPRQKNETNFEISQSQVEI